MLFNNEKEAAVSFSFTRDIGKLIFLSLVLIILLYTLLVKKSEKQ